MAKFRDRKIRITNKGASKAQEDLAAQQASFYKTLTDSYNKQFTAQSAILASLQEAWGPILKAGPGQYGFTPAEDTALRTQATEGTAQQYAAAAKTTGENIAARGGGNTLLPSGAEAQIEGEIATKAAEQESSEQLGITQAGYERGYQNFLAASNALAGSATIYNPVSYAGAANTSGSDAFSSATTIQQENNASGFFGALGGILGGAATSFAGGVAGPIGTSIGKRVGG